METYFVKPSAKLQQGLVKEHSSRMPIIVSCLPWQGQYKNNVVIKMFTQYDRRIDVSYKQQQNNTSLSKRGIKGIFGLAFLGSKKQNWLI